MEEEDDEEEEGEGSLRLDMVDSCQTVFISASDDGEIKVIVVLF